MTITPHSPDNIGAQTPFAHAWPLYRRKGWPGVLPLPRGQKHPPPTNWTGGQEVADRVPDVRQLAVWEREYVGGNVCLRLWAVDSGHEIVGIDVDDYLKGGRQKRGGSQLEALENDYGSLPDTWVSSARSDGVSGIRYFRVPEGLAWRGQVDKDIECVSKGYRFAAVWPSINPEADNARYRWYPPGRTPDGQHYADDIPDANALPPLPGPWVDYLTRGRMRDNGKPIDMDSTPTELGHWADNAFHGNANTAPCTLMRQKINLHKHLIASEATSHDKIVNAHMNVLHLAREGHVGWIRAIDEIENFYAANVLTRDKRGETEVRREVWRSRTNGLRKVKGFADRCNEIGAIATHVRCECDQPPMKLPALADLIRPTIREASS